MTMWTRAAAILLAIALTADIAPALAETARTVVIPGATEVSPDAVPADILAAMLAGARAAKGESDLSGGLKIAKLAPGGSIARQGSPLDRDFAVERVNLISVVQGSRPGERKIFGLIDFVKTGGLRAQIAVLIDYVADQDGLAIGNIQLMGVTPTDQRIAVFVLPAAAALRLLGDTATPQEDFIKWVAQHGRPLPLAARPSQSYVVALSLDQVLAGDRIELALDAGGKTIVSPTNLMTVRDGYPVTLLPVPDGGTLGSLQIRRLTQMHGKQDDGRRVIGSLALQR